MHGETVKKKRKVLYIFVYIYFIYQYKYSMLNCLQQTLQQTLRNPLIYRIKHVQESKQYSAIKQALHHDNFPGSSRGTTLLQLEVRGQLHTLLPGKQPSVINVEGADRTLLSIRTHLRREICMTLHPLYQCFSTFVRPRPGKLFFYKTRARSQTNLLVNTFPIFLSSYIKIT